MTVVDTMSRSQSVVKSPNAQPAQPPAWRCRGSGVEGNVVKAPVCANFCRAAYAAGSPLRFGADSIRDTSDRCKSGCCGHSRSLSEVEKKQQPKQDIAYAAEAARKRASSKLAPRGCGEREGLARQTSS